MDTKKIPQSLCKYGRMQGSKGKVSRTELSKNQTNIKILYRSNRRPFSIRPMTSKWDRNQLVYCRLCGPVQLSLPPMSENEMAEEIIGFIGLKRSLRF